MASAGSPPDASQADETVSGNTASQQPGDLNGIGLTSRAVIDDDASGSAVSELIPDVAALEAAIDAAADASLRIYLVRQDAEAAAMIDEARASGDALYAAKLKEIADAEAAAAAAAVAEAAAAADSLNPKNLLMEQSRTPHTADADNLSSAAVAPEVASTTEAVPVEGCPEPWESNPKFSPCRKFMAEFCTIHGTDPRSRCCILNASFCACI